MKTIQLQLLILLTICINATAYAQSKISPELLSAIEHSASIDCMIYFQGKANLDPAKSITGKIAKGKYVISTLKSMANQSQDSIKLWLNSEKINYQSFWIVNAIQATLNESQINYLSSRQEIALIAENSRIKMEVLPEMPDKNPIQSAQRQIEWGIGYIRADEVWDLGFTGEGIVIGGQDTGYEWEHTTLINKYRGYDPITGTADHNYNWHDAIHNAGQGNPCGSNSPEPCDDNNHGTHTMGTMIGDDGGNNQIGVAPNAKWIGCRNMDSGDGTPATYMECFEWFLEPTDLDGQNPDPSLAPHVINNSWSCPLSEGCDNSNFEAMRQVIENLKAAGIVVVVSNGNSGSSCSSTNAPPAFFTESFSIGASNASGDLASFSSRGPSGLNGGLKPNVTAPGVAVRSAIRNNGFASYSGTSMAGPHVAGVVALMLSANPNLIGEVETIEDILEQTAIPAYINQTCGGIPGSESPNNSYGYGIIDALEAVEEAIGFLPAQLIYFQLDENNQRTRKLSWTIQAAYEGQPVQLVRSIDLTHWKVLSNFNLNTGTELFQFEDDSPLNSIYYYRLLWFNEAGDTFYSPILVAVPSTLSFRIYPNPTSNTLKIYVGSTENLIARVEITDMLGRIYHVGEVIIENGISPSLSLERLPVGIYHIKLFDKNLGNSLANLRFVKD